MCVSLKGRCSETARSGFRRLSNQRHFWFAAGDFWDFPPWDFPFKFSGPWFAVSGNVSCPRSMNRISLRILGPSNGRVWTCIAGPGPQMFKKKRNQVFFKWGESYIPSTILCRFWHGDVVKFPCRHCDLPDAVQRRRRSKYKKMCWCLGHSCRIIFCWRHFGWILLLETYGPRTVLLCCWRNSQMCGLLPQSHRLNKSKALGWTMNIQCLRFLLRRKAYLLAPSSGECEAACEMKCVIEVIHDCVVQMFEKDLMGWENLECKKNRKIRNVMDIQQCDNCSLNSVAV